MRETATVAQRKPATEFDLLAEAAALRKQPAFKIGRNAKTLVKYHDLRLVLTVLRAGARVQEHKTAGRISIHTISGAVRVHLPGGPVDLPAGNLLALDQGLAHDVEALEDSAFLLTICWPQTA